MTNEEIWDIMIKAMSEEFELETGKMTPEAEIKADLGLDSLDIVDLVTVLETAFDFKIRDKAAMKEIRTLGDVAAFIAATTAAAPLKAPH
ncbi:MAG: phosphopantetheine-binding protein [Candidatus Adiutrix sp.]|jgi:acyl carrier protein|nr:phosphopantetheine-binding protein [Candidatus Adiutrix sp.]